MNRVGTPALAQATAWFEPFPPGPVTKVPITVSPAPGNFAHFHVRSCTKLPTTMTLGFIGTR